MVDGRTVKREEHRLRADALRNRERIVAAARDALVEHGAEVPFDEIARRAGVGNATLYRHFKDRRELIHAVKVSVMARIVDHAESALAEEPDAFEALGRFVHQAADERVGALRPVMAGWIDKTDPVFVAARARLVDAIERLMAAAQSSGQLRTDIAVGDLLGAVTQLARPLPGAACADMDQFAHRHLQLFLDGLRTPPRSVLPGSATTLADLERLPVPADRSQP